MFHEDLANALRAGLDYGDELHLSIKNFNPISRQGHLRQLLVWWTRYKTNKNKQKIASSWSSLKAQFLVQGFEVAQELNLTSGELH